MKLYLLAAALFAAAAYLLLTPPSIEPMELRAGTEITVEQYQQGAAAEDCPPGAT